MINVNALFADIVGQLWKSYGKRLFEKLEELVRENHSVRSVSVIEDELYFEAFCFEYVYSTVNITDTSSPPQRTISRCSPFSSGRLPENGRFRVIGARPS